MNTVLSLIERLPGIAIPAIQRAYDLIAANRATQKAAYAQLNAELAGLGLGPISRSAFNRWATTIGNCSSKRPTLLPSSGLPPRGRLPSGHASASPETISLLSEAVNGVFRYFHGDGIQIDQQRVDLFERCAASMRRDLEAGKAA